MLVGQKKILNKLNSLTLDTLPHSLLLVGGQGCGKHSLCKQIVQQFGLNLKEITESVNLEVVESIYENPVPCLYLFNGDLLSVKEQNCILKLVEEPPVTAFVIILSEQASSILPTILNRVQQWNFESYSREDLDQFIPESLQEDKELAFRLARTPGQLLQLDGVNVKEMISLANKIIDKIGVASFPNTLTLVDKVAFKDEKGKFEVKLFTRALSASLVRRIEGSEDERYTDAYEAIVKLIKLQSQPRIDQKYAYENFLVNLWSIMRKF